MSPELEKELWKERTRQLALLLKETKNRLEGDSDMLPSEKTEWVADWLGEVLAGEWVANTLKLPHPKPALLVKIEAAIEAAYDHP